MKQCTGSDCACTLHDCRGHVPTGSIYRWPCWYTRSLWLVTYAACGSGPVRICPSLSSMCTEGPLCCTHWRAFAITCVSRLFCLFSRVGVHAELCCTEGSFLLFWQTVRGVDWRCSLSRPVESCAPDAPPCNCCLICLHQPPGWTSGKP